MSQIRFTKKSKVILRSDTESVLDGYIPIENGFPFSIAKKYYKVGCYWLIVNRFSGKPFVTRFSRKRDAERFFEKFIMKYDINDIDFKNPNSNFNYRIASFAIQKLIKQDNYRKYNFGELNEKSRNF